MLYNFSEQYNLLKKIIYKLEKKIALALYKREIITYVPNIVHNKKEIVINVLFLKFINNERNLFINTIHLDINLYK